MQRSGNDNDAMLTLKISIYTRSQRHCPCTEAQSCTMRSRGGDPQSLSSPSSRSSFCGGALRGGGSFRGCAGGAGGFRGGAAADVGICDIFRGPGLCVTPFAGTSLPTARGATAAAGDSWVTEEVCCGFSFCPEAAGFSIGERVEEGMSEGRPEPASLCAPTPLTTTDCGACGGGSLTPRSGRRGSGSAWGSGSGSGSGSATIPSSSGKAGFGAAAAALVAAAIETETELAALALPLESLRFAGRVALGFLVRVLRFGVCRTSSSS